MGPLDGERQYDVKLTLPSSTPGALEIVVGWVKEARMAVLQRLGLQGWTEASGKWGWHRSGQLFIPGTPFLLPSMLLIPDRGGIGEFVQRSLHQVQPPTAKQQ